VWEHVDVGSWEVTEKENRLSMGRRSLDFSAGGYGVSQFFGEGTLMDVWVRKRVGSTVAAIGGECGGRDYGS
jgi:hypothetical protein